MSEVTTQDLLKSIQDTISGLSKKNLDMPKSSEAPNLWEKINSTDFTGNNAPVDAALNDDHNVQGGKNGPISKDLEASLVNALSINNDK